MFWRLLSDEYVFLLLLSWFSWTKCHQLEKQTLHSFFNGESESRTPEVYMEIRNWIMERFHANPHTNIDIKDLSELSTGDSDARQEVLEFLDHWDLINYHPLLQNDTVIADADTNADGDKTENTNSLMKSLFQFENEQSFPELVPKANASQTLSTGLLRESAIAEEFTKQEGPAVEYHCNSCSADCSRKRYHCQKQADFDLCTECFNNEKFGSGMSSSDFILMEPGEASSATGGTWTDQETLLLLEALELFSENWNEVAEHVATKTKAQCILHFLQMPIEDSFLDDEDTEDSVKQTADPTLSSNDLSVREDNVDPSEEKMCEDIPDQTGNESGIEKSEPPAIENAKDDPEPSERKTDFDADQPSTTPMEILNLEEAQGDKLTRENSDSFVLDALMEAFNAVGSQIAPQDNLCFAEAGNSVMALAAFLTQLVEPSLAMASARCSLKSISKSSPGSQLAARHCFILEDPPTAKKEQTMSKSTSSENFDQNKTEESENNKEITPIKENTTIDGDKSSSLLNGSHSAGDQIDKKKSSDPEDDQGLASAGQKVLQDKPKFVEKRNGKKATVVEIPKKTPKVAKKSRKEKSGDAEEPAEEPKKTPKVAKKSGKEKSGGAEEPDEEKSQVEDKKTETTSTTEQAEHDDSSSKVIRPLSSSDCSGHMREVSEVVQCLEGINMKSSLVVSDNVEQQDTVLADPVAGVGSGAGSDIMEVDKTEDLKTFKTARVDDDENVAKLKRAALATISAAAVKAKLLAHQEEDEIKQLSIMLIEKQLRKLEVKLSFFSEMEGTIMRVREQLVSSRHKLFAERAQIIASRLGLPASARGVPSSHPLNRMPANLLNSVLRPPMNMSALRPPMSRPVMPSAGPPTNSAPPPDIPGPMAVEKPSTVGTD